MGQNAAHKEAFSEGRVRMIMTMYGDTGPTDKLDYELRAYVTMETYVKWVTVGSGRNYVTPCHII